MKTFENKYSDWYNPLGNYQQNQYQELVKLVLEFNENLKNEVLRAYKKHNQKVRSIISDKTGLSLTHIIKSSEEEIFTNEFENPNERTSKTSIPIKIVDKVPTSLLEIFEKYDPRIIELLLHYRSMEHSVIELKFQLRTYDKFQVFHKGISKIDEIKNVISHLSLLKKEVEDSGIIDDIRELGPDMLGAYFIKERKIELYWLAIGLLSIIHDKPVEYFTLVVLIHELAHGYTHLGSDKDGNTWETRDFTSTDLRIVEGFAQFYTEKSCKDFFPQALDAFYSLLTKQSIEYTDYKGWFKENETFIYEKARRVLLTIRMHRIKEYPPFKNQLEIIKREY